MYLCSDSAVQMYYVLAPIPVSLVLTLSKYVLKYGFFMSNFLRFMLQLIFNFMTLIRVSTHSFCHSRENFVFDSRLRALYKKKLLWIKSNLWSSQLKTRELKFIVVVIIGLCGKFLSSPVLYTNSKYVSYVWTFLCLCILTSSNISEIYMTAYFGYFSDILHVVYNHSPSVPYHLTWWRKQTCCFVSVIWVDHSKVLCDWGCDSCFLIAWQFLIGFSLVLFSSFELHIVWLNYLFIHILFDWTVAVAVPWLNRFSNCIVLDWTVYLAIYYLLNRSHNRVCWNCH